MEAKARAKVQSVIKDGKSNFYNWLYRDYQYKPYMYDMNFKAPDWRQYKVENCPRLSNVQSALAFHGLKDPWLRWVLILLPRVKKPFA